MTTTTATTRPQFDRVQQLALIIGIVGLGVSAVGLFLSREQFFQSYLFAYLYWLGFALGSLALCMVQHLAGGVWGALTRRILEAGMMTLPLMAVLFIPILLGMQDLYVWSLPAEAAIAEVGEIIYNDFTVPKLPYLNPLFFTIRAVSYFAIWFAFAFVLYRWSQEQDRTADPRLISKFKGLSGIGILLFVLAMTFAAIDWGMSIEPEFFSAIYGLIFVVGYGLATFALLIVTLSLLMERLPFAGLVTPNRVHDLGKFLLGFVVLWTYVNLSQFIIIWSGNLPEEIPWYIHRGEGGWNILSIILVVFHFLLPFFILLSRQLKRSIRLLSVVAIFILFMRLVDLFWLIAPSFHPDAFTFSWLDITTVVGLGGLWVAAFVWLLKRQPLLPLHDHRLTDPGMQHEAPPLTDSVSSRPA